MIEVAHAETETRSFQCQARLTRLSKLLQGTLPSRASVFCFKFLEVSHGLLTELASPSQPSVWVLLDPPPIERHHSLGT